MRAPIRSQHMEAIQGIYKKTEEMAHASAFFVSTEIKVLMEYQHNLRIRLAVLCAFGKGCNRNQKGQSIKHLIFF